MGNIKKELKAKLDFDLEEFAGMTAEQMEKHVEMRCHYFKLDIFKWMKENKWINDN